VRLADPITAVRLVSFGGVANCLELESVRIEPVGRETVFPVLEEFAWLVQDYRFPGTSPRVCFSDDRSARDQEREVMKTRLAP